MWCIVPIGDWWRMSKARMKAKADFTRHNDWYHWCFLVYSFNSNLAIDNVHVTEGKNKGQILIFIEQLGWLVLVGVPLSGCIVPIYRGLTRSVKARKQNQSNFNRLWIRWNSLRRLNMWCIVPIADWRGISQAKMKTKANFTRHDWDVSRTRSWCVVPIPI